MQRAAQWRLDFVAAENSMGFHAPQEMARILAESIDLSRQAQVKATRSWAAVFRRRPWFSPKRERRRSSWRKTHAPSSGGRLRGPESWGGNVPT